MNLRMNWVKVEATFQVAPKKGWLENLKVIISETRRNRAILTPVLECLLEATIFLLHYTK